jgi:hypothetical protein
MGIEGQFAGLTVRTERPTAFVRPGRGKGYLSDIGRFAMRLQVGQRMSALPGYLRHQLGPLFASPCLVAEHSSVMSMVFVSSHFRK